MQEIYDDYWSRMQFREEFNRIGKIPVKRWRQSEDLNEIEQVYFDKMQNLGSILEIGSGTNILQQKFLREGYRGTYHTMDLSREFPHNYHDLNEVTCVYDGMIILEVIEHMKLEEFWSLLDFIDSHLAPDGTLVISTCQPGSIVPWESWDMTHVQHYPLHDLYALLRARGYSAQCYRIWIQKQKCSGREKIRLWLRKVLCCLLGVDYADTAALIARKKSAPVDGIHKDTVVAGRAMDHSMDPVESIPMTAIRP